MASNEAPNLYKEDFTTRVKFAFCVLAALALMTIDRRYDHLKDIRMTVAQAISPIEAAATIPSEVAKNAGGYFQVQSQLINENDSLRSNNLKLRVRLQKLQALESENERLRRLLDSPRKPGQRILISSIIGANSDKFNHSVKIDKGLRHGVFEGQTAVDESGVVGQVVEVDTNSSTVLLISDESHELPAQILRTGQTTVVAGSGLSKDLRLDYLPLDADVQLGDVITTSGLGGVFPADLPVGKVTSVQTTPGNPYLDVRLVPDAKLNRARDIVLVFPMVAIQGDIATGESTVTTQ